eukprot:m.83235 g.83235  ORF g.83235 m.83235 type:complete len:496 (-) comp25608_c0_seq2:39-1526(-)
MATLRVTVTPKVSTTCVSMVVIMLAMIRLTCGVEPNEIRPIDLSSFFENVENHQSKMHDKVQIGEAIDRAFRERGFVVVTGVHYMRQKQQRQQGTKHTHPANANDHEHDHHHYGEDASDSSTPIASETSMTSNGVDSVFPSVQRLFACQGLTKVAFATIAPLRGHLSLGVESGLGKNFELKEGYSYGDPTNTFRTNGHDAPNDLRHTNVWPDDLNTIDKGLLEAQFVLLNSIAEAVTSSLVRYASSQNTTSLAPIERLEQLTRGGREISLLRLFRYFPTNSKPFSDHTNGGGAGAGEGEGGREEEAPTARNILGSSAHTDWGFLTVIDADRGDGLQFYDQSTGSHATWVNVNAAPGTFVVNAGDYLRAVSNERYISPIHRVLLPKTHERLSFVYFYYPGFDSPLLTPTESTSHSTPPLTDRVANGKENQIKGNQKETTYNGTNPEVEHVSPNTNTNTKAVEEYNTLYNLPSVTHHTKFGEFIVEKWRDVYRDKNL